MLLQNITAFCNYEYQNKECCYCTYDAHCPDNCCDRCLHYIHTPNAAPAPRRYDCPNMANFYTCKYSHKYTSELIYALEQLKDLRKKKHLKIMSVGCGPCTDLFAIDYLRENNIYRFNSVEFRGIDPAKNVWKHIHNQIKKQKKNYFRVNFYYDDITELIDTIVQVDWIPDLIIFQYVFSDMEKHCVPDKLKGFIKKVANFINEEMDENTYVVLNDINLTTRKGGGREHFDALLRRIPGSQYRQYHFENSNRDKHYEYGTEYESNDLRIKLPQDLRFYVPFDSCASAQLIIKKVIE